MVGGAIAGYFIQKTFVFPWSFYIISHGIGYFFGKISGISQVVLAFVFMYPWGFGKAEAIKFKLLDFTIYFYHIVFQFCIVTFPVSPENPCLSIIFNIYGRVYAGPAMCRSKTIFSCQ